MMHFNPKPPVRRCSAHPAGDLENPGGGSPVLTDLAGRGPMVRYGFKDSNFNGEKKMNMVMIHANWGGIPFSDKAR